MIANFLRREVTEFIHLACAQTSLAVKLAYGDFPGLSPPGQAEPVRATGNRYPEGGTFAGKKRKPLLRALAPPHFQGLSDSLSPFLGRGYGAYRPQQTHTKVGLELAGDTQGDKLAKPSPERGRTPRPLRLGAGVRGRAGKAALPASPQHFYGGGD